MFKTFAVAVALVAATSANAVTISLTGGGTYVQDFNTLAATGTSSVLPIGVQIAEGGVNADSTYTAGTGSATAGDSYSFGAAGSSDRALGGLRSGSLIPLFGISFTNNTGVTITGLSISYIGEQWRLGTAGRADRLDFQYAIGASNIGTTGFVDANVLDFSSPITTGSTGALDGNAAANRQAISSVLSGLTIANGASFTLQWLDLDATGADDGLAIDDFRLTPTLQVGAVPEPDTWAMMIIGFGLAGVAIRRRRRAATAAAA